MAEDDLTTAMLAVLRHPLRREILRLFLTTEQATSPIQISRRMKHPLSNVSYHVRKLDEAGAIELADTTPARGSLQHFYRANADLRKIGWIMEAMELDRDDEIR